MTRTEKERSLDAILERLRQKTPMSLISSMNGTSLKKRNRLVLNLQPW